MMRSSAKHEEEIDVAQLVKPSTTHGGVHGARGVGSSSAFSNSKMDFATIYRLSWLFLLTFSAMGYYKSLEGGPDENWIHSALFRMALWELASIQTFCLSTVVAVMFVSRSRWKILMLVAQIAVFSFLFSIDQGSSLQSHGSYNSLIFVVILVPMLLATALIYVCFKYIHWKTIVKIFLTILLLTTILFVWRASAVRNDWIYGLNGKMLETPDDHFCKIRLPLINSYSILPYRGWNFWTGSHSCNYIPQFSSLYNNRLLIDGCVGDVTITKLPKTESYNFTQKHVDFSHNEFQLQILANVEKIVLPGKGDKHLLEIEDSEAIVVECDGYENVHLQSLKKMQVSRRVKQFYQDTNKKITERTNVLVLNFDAVSRAHFHRRLTKTKAFFERLNNDPNSKSEVFEFFRYHSVGVTTTNNLRSMYTGARYPEIYENSTTIWEHYREAGYVTAFADNSCLDWSGKYQKRVSKLDHQMVAPFCLPEVHPLGTPYGIWTGPFSVRRRCLAGRYVHSYVFDYLKSFYESYNDVPSFVIGAFNEGHEGTGELIKLVDDDLVNFLENDVDLDKTIVFVISDHGLHMGIPFMLDMYSAQAENRFGLMMMMTPRKLLAKYPELRSTLQHNTQSLVTPPDLYETLGNLIDFPNLLQPKRQPTSLSLVHEKVSYNRTCIDADMEKYMCYCNRFYTRT